MEIYKPFLHRYMNTVAPVGMEQEAQDEIIKFLTEDGNPAITYEIDTLGSLVITYNGDNAWNIIEGMEYKKLVLDAHADEISWRVNKINDDGLINVIRNGGSDHMIAPSQHATLYTENGDKLEGVFGFPAIHTRGRAEDPKVKTSFLTFDLGLDSKDEVLEKGVNVGDIICYTNPFKILGDKYVGRALDNKIGGFIMASVIHRLAENSVNLGFEVCFVNAVQEEVGLYGARTVAQWLKPDAAIVVDVCHDTSTHGIDKNVEGDIKIGKGIVVAKSPTINTKMFKEVIKSANELDITVQRTALGSQTGTNTDEYVYQNGGTPATLISIPLKYMHTTVEMCHEKDVLEAIDIIYNMILNFKFE